VIIYLLCTGVVAASITACVGVGTLYLIDASIGHFFELWVIWWLGDVMGAIVIGPALLVWLRPTESHEVKRKSSEYFILIVSLFTINTLIFSGIIHFEGVDLPLAMLCIPLFLWAAFSFGPNGAIMATLITSGISILCTSMGYGPFVSSSTLVSLILLQSFIGVVATTSLLLGVDHNERKRIEQVLSVKEALYRTLVEHLPQVVWLADADGKVSFINQEWHELTGLSIKESLGDQWMQVVHEDDIGIVQAKFKEALESKKEFTAQWRAKSKDGSYKTLSFVGAPVEDSFGQVISWVGINTDVSERIKSEQELKKLANYDALTDLPNRSYFNAVLEKTVSQAARHKRNGALLFIDLDNFKTINDTLGHQVGDLLLIEVAKRLGSRLRKEDLVARLGGDEFAIILGEIQSSENALQVANELIEILQPAYLLDGYEVTSTASIGVACFPQAGTNPEELIRNADVAMYKAKSLGRNTTQSYSGDMNKSYIRRSKLESSLNSAIAENELFLNYQPKVRISDSKTVSIEALMYWQHPELGRVKASEFIPIAEEKGLIIQLSRWLVETTFQQFSSWRAEHENLNLALNASPHLLLQGEFVKIVKNELQKFNIPASAIELELTESKLMNRASQAEDILRQLDKLGVKIVIDDFGTGHSSLSRLKHLPISSLIIDRSFIRDISNDEKDAAIVKSIVALADSMELDVVAEGVETEAQLHFLKEIGCDLAQGSYFCKQLSADLMTAYLTS